MAFENLSPVGGDAFTDGFLNKKFANLVISRIGSLSKAKVIMPPGCGTGKVIFADEGWVLDLSGMTVGGFSRRIIMNINGQETPVLVPITLTT